MQCKIKYKEFKKVCLKNHTSYYFSEIIKLEDFDIYDVLIDEQLHEKILIYDVSNKTFNCFKTFAN